jgi:hypothetical protein
MEESVAIEKKKKILKKKKNTGERRPKEEMRIDNIPSSTIKRVGHPGPLIRRIFGIPIALALAAAEIIHVAAGGSISIVILSNQHQALLGQCYGATDALTCSGCTQLVSSVSGL